MCGVLMPLICIVLSILVECWLLHLCDPSRTTYLIHSHWLDTYNWSCHTHHYWYLCVNQWLLERTMQFVECLIFLNSPSVLGDLDADRRLHLVVCTESKLPKVLSRFGTPLGGIDHGYMVRYLPGQLDEVCGHFNDVITARLHFW